ncbi:MAG: serine hydrolase domain-containing protein [Syntrophothermus sp.]
MSIIEEFENQLRKDLQDDNINGSMSAAVVEKDTVIWANAFGPIHRNGDRPADANTIYRSGSITKSFTAFLMMQLVEEGTMALDQPVENYLPEIRQIDGYSNTSRFTVHQLASHTAGLVREPKLDKADAGPIERWEEKVLQSIPQTSFEAKPGEKFSYSNIGYGILGLALSRAAKRPFIEMIEQRIFQPLQMDNSFFVVPEHKLGNLAQGMGGGPFGDEEIDFEGPQKEHAGRGYKVPNGGIYSTPADLAKFMICNMGYSDLLDKQSLELLHTKQTPEPAYHCYGLGFELYQDPSISIAGHAGGVPGYTSYFGFEKEYQYGVILMRNYNWGMTSWDFGPKVLLRKLADLQRNRQTQIVSFG